MHCPSLDSGLKREQKIVKDNWGQLGTTEYVVRNAMSPTSLWGAHLSMLALQILPFCLARPSLATS